MIVVATSGANDCLYCIVAHGAILRIYAKNPLVADQVAVNYRKADITPRQKAMLAFAMKVATDSVAIDDADFAALHEHGFSDEDIWDIGAIAAFFALSNRMANLIAMRPNDEFYLRWGGCRRGRCVDPAAASGAAPIDVDGRSRLVHDAVRRTQRARARGPRLRGRGTACSCPGCAARRRCTVHGAAGSNMHTSAALPGASDGGATPRIAAGARRDPRERLDERHARPRPPT